MVEIVNKLSRTSRQQVQQLGREPRLEEIARRMDIPVAKLRKVLKVRQETISLETPIGEEGDAHLGELIEDRAVISPAEAVINVSLKEQTAAVLRTLTSREEQVLKMRFGLEDGSQHTLEEVGQCFAVTCERIRQIEAKALRKLRNPARSLSSSHFWNTDTNDALIAWPTLAIPCRLIPCSVFWINTVPCARARTASQSVQMLGPNFSVCLFLEGNLIFDSASTPLGGVSRLGAVVWK